MIQQPTPSATLRKSLLLIEEFRKLNPEMPIQVVATFLLIADKPRRPLAEMTKILDQGKSSVNRNVAALAQKYGLVDYGRDPVDARNNIAWLTPKGTSLIRSLDKHLG